MRFTARETRCEERVGAWRWIVLVTCLSTLVSACGFHLRGTVVLPPAMARTYITGANNSPLYYELESALLAAGGQVVDSAEAASAVLTIHSEHYGRRVLSVDSTGRASEYELSLRVLFSLNNAAGETLAQRSEVAVLRDYRFDPDNVLASGEQEATLLAEMRRYAVRQMLRRLESVSRNPPPTASATPQE